MPAEPLPADARAAESLPPLLLVEDDAVFRMLIKRLVGKDFLIEEAATLEEAQAVLGKRPFACVLLDYRLPDGTGFDLLPHVIEIELPAVMMTAMGHEQLAIDAVRHGCQDYLVKDELNRASLFRSLNNAMRYSRQQRQAARHRLALAEAISAATAHCLRATEQLRQMDGVAVERLADAAAAHLLQVDQAMEGLAAHARLISPAWRPETVAWGEIVQETLRELQPILDDTRCEVVFGILPPFPFDRLVAKVLFRWLLQYAVTAATGADSPIDVQAISHETEWHLTIRLPRTSTPHDTSAGMPENEEAAPLALGSDQAAGLDQARGLMEHLGGHVSVGQDADETTKIVVTVPLPRAALIPSHLRGEG